MTHKVILNGYSALLPGANKSPVIALGTAGSYGIERLQLVPDARWQGLIITATFHPVAGDPVRVFAGPDNLLDVPPEATAIAATKEKPGKIVFAGVADGVQRISCDLPYIVDTHAAVEGQESSATPDVLAQAIAQTGAARDEAVQAAAEAKEALAGIGDSVDRAEAAADRAEQAAASIEGAAAEVEAAKADALEAVTKAESAAVESVTAAGGKAVESVETVASESVTDVNNAKQSALDAITSGKDTALNAVSLAQSSAVQAIQGAQSAAETAISEAETGALENIATEKEASVKAVNEAGSTATGAIADAKADALSEIETAKTGAVEAVTAEGDKQAERVQAIFPAVTVDDDGKVPIVQNGAWTLGEVAQDAYTQAESDARYAPIEASIRLTANGNPAVCEDSIAWGFQGLKVYGKSTQDGTPSPENPVSIVSAGEGGSVELGVTGAQQLPEQQISNIYINGAGTLAGLGDSDRSKWFEAFPGKTYYVKRASPGTRFRLGCVNEIPVAGKTVPVISKSISNTAQNLSITATGKYIIINLESEDGFDGLMVSLQSYEDYQPYQSQSLPLFTPSGLPGIPVESGGNYIDASGQQLTSDYWDFGAGQQHILCGEIASYNGEEITTPYISSTGALTTGAQVLYVLPKPRTEPIPAETMAAYRALITYPGTTIVSTAEPVAGIETKYVVDPQKYIEKYVDEKVSDAVSKAITAAVKLSGGNT